MRFLDFAFHGAVDDVGKRPCVADQMLGAGLLALVREIGKERAGVELA